MINGWLLLVLVLFAAPLSWSSNKGHPTETCMQPLLPDGSGVLLTPEQWNHYLGDVWQHVISSYRVPKNGVVAEIAPGNVEKVGLGFQQYGFRGTYYIIEPHAESLAILTTKYRALMPNATIVPLQKTLAQAITDLPHHLDAVVANHPLDDIIIGKSLTSDAFSDFFSKMYEKSDDQLTQNIWALLATNPDIAEKFCLETTQEWDTLINHTHPSLVAIAQYAGLYHLQNNFDVADQYALKALNLLKQRWQQPWRESNAKAHRVLSQVGQSASRWLIYQPSQSLEVAIAQPPVALENRGEQTFVPTQAWQVSPDDMELVYIDEDVLSALGHGDLLKDRHKLQEALFQSFALDLEKPQLDLPSRKVWVDRQSDPLNIAMNGNLGSGRAVYIGSRFNIKGVGRTPLAQGPLNGVHSNGRLSFGGGLWEALVSNSLHSNLRTSSSAILAVFKYKNKTFPAPWGDGSLQTQASLLVRVDDGSLQRPVHLFENPSAAPQVDLKAITTKFAQQDAEKFAERIVHGAWSSGNISLEGHLIDMDTVTAVTGRSPQYSLTGKFPANLFGFESIGQINIIEAITKNETLNREQRTFTELKDHFFKVRRQHLERRMLDLWGIDPRYNTKAQLVDPNLLQVLVTTFEELSRQMFPDLLSLGTWNANSRSKHVFDFSSFFRRYPLLRKTYSDRTLRAEQAMKYLRQTKGDFNFTDNPWISSEVRELLNTKYVVKNESELNALETKARIFLTKWDLFFDTLERFGLLGNIDFMITRAYVANEDRLYLTDSYGAPLLFKLAEENQTGLLPSEQLNHLMALLVRANDRNPMPNQNNQYLTDFRLLRQGYLYRELTQTNENQIKQTIKIHIFANAVPPQNSHSQWTLQIGHQFYPLTAQRNHRQELVLQSGALSNLLLLNKKTDLQLLHNNRPFSFNEWNEGLSQNPRSDFTFEVHQQ